MTTSISSEAFEKSKEERDNKLAESQKYSHPLIFLAYFRLG